MTLKIQGYYIRVFTVFQFGTFELLKNRCDLLDYDHSSYQISFKEVVGHLDRFGANIFQTLLLNALSFDNQKRKTISQFLVPELKRSLSRILLCLFRCHIVAFAVHLTMTYDLTLRFSVSLTGNIKY